MLVPSSLDVGALQESVAEPDPIAWTEMGNGPIEALLAPSLTEMVMLGVWPSSLGDGVPLTAPVVVSKVIQPAWPSILKVRPVPLTETVGLKEYVLPTAALEGGVP